MSKKIILLVIPLIFLALTVKAEGLPLPTYVDSSLKKAQRGFTNFFTGWLEIPYQIKKGFDAGIGEPGKNRPLGATLGVFRGLAHAAGRTLNGAFQLVTFYLPSPKSNEGVGIPLDAENAWEQGKQYSIVNDGVEPIGRKGMRGLVNALFGFLEMPGQVAKGFAQDKPIKGIGKAIIYPLGRVSSGIYDVATVLLPNDTVEVGNPLEEKQPWDAFNKESYGNGL